MVGVQSYPEYIRSLQERFEGVPVLCDVEGEVYNALELGSAADREELGREPIVAEVIAKAKAAELVHGEDSGNPLQYPGLFVIAPNGEIRYAFRAKAPAGLPSLAEALREASRSQLTISKKGRGTNWFLSLFFVSLLDRGIAPGDLLPLIEMLPVLGNCIASGALFHQPTLGLLPPSLFHHR